MTAPHRTIALRRAPREHEPLDAWVLAYAHLLSAAPGELAAHAGLQETVVSISALELARDGLAGIEQLESVAGRPLRSLQALVTPVSRYARIAASVPNIRGVDATRLNPWSRYCPTCLSEGSAWDWRWRIAWYITCEKHHSQLMTQCPDCSGQQRHGRIRNSTLSAAPHQCDRPAPAATGRHPQICAAELTTAALVEVPNDVARLQSHLIAAMQSPNDGELRQALTDLRLLLPPRALQLFKQHKGQECDDIATELAHVAPAMLDQVMTTVVTANKWDTKRLTPMPKQWQYASTQTYSAITMARAPYMPAHEQLRWSTATGSTRPWRGAQDIADLAQHIPVQLWPETSLRLMPTDVPSTHPLFRTCASAALLIPGSALDIDQATGIQRATGTTHEELLRILRLVLTKSRHGQTIINQLTLLATHLHHNTPPINYRKRRLIHLNQDILTDSNWRTACELMGREPTSSKLRKAMEQWIWLLVTGNPTQAIGLTGKPLVEAVQALTALNRNATQELLRHLTRVGRQLLDAHNMAQEPLTWEPPATEWMNPDTPDEHKRTAICNETFTSSKSLSDIASDHRITLEQARIIVTSHQANTSRPACIDAHTTRMLQRRTNPNDFDNEIRHAISTLGLSQREAASKLATSRKKVSERCHTMELAPRPRERMTKPTPQWLHDQYTVKQRTLKELAEEASCSASQMARILRDAQIPLRPQGGASHRSAITDKSTYPELLRSALKGQHAQQRIHRFTQVAQYPSMNQASIALDISYATLHTQIHLLEKSVGGPLITKNAKRMKAMTVTALGHQLIEEARTHLSKEMSEYKTSQDESAA